MEKGKPGATTECTKCTKREDEINREDAKTRMTQRWNGSASRSEAGGARKTRGNHGMHGMHEKGNKPFRFPCI